jgi:type IV secretory pathway VirJ component
MFITKSIYVIGIIAGVIFNDQGLKACSFEIRNNLPILEFPVESNQDYFVLLFTGDGGWKSIDQSITSNLNVKKVPVVALNIMKYLWNEKKPLQVAKDLELLIDSYLRKWNKQHVVVIGYSLGAEILPFTLNLTNIYYLAKIKDLILIAPSQRTSFKIKVKNYIVDDNEGQEVLPELRKLKLTNKYCICDDKKYSLCMLGIDGIMEYSVLRGGHHFDGDFRPLNNLINKRLNLD